MRLTCVLPGVVLGAVSCHGQTGAPLAPHVPMPTTTTAPGVAIGPRLELSEREWNFGEVWQGTDLHKEIRIRNTGTAQLILSDIKGSCGCTAVRAPKTVLAPGESDILEVRYDSRSKVGVAHQHVLIKCNDPAAAETRFMVNGNVKMLYTLSKQAGASFGRLTAEMKESQRIEIRNAYPQPLRLTLETPPPDAPMDATLRETQPGLVYELEVTTRPPLRTGPYAGAVVLKTNYESLPEIRVFCSMVVQSRVALEPASLMLPYSPTSPGTRNAKLAYLSERPVRVTAVRSPVPEVTAVVEAEPPPRPGAAPPLLDHFRQVLVRVTAAAGYELPASGLDMEILTDDPEFPRFVLKLTGQRARASIGRGKPGAGRPAEASQPAAVGRP